MLVQLHETIRYELAELCALDRRPTPNDAANFPPLHTPLNSSFLILQQFPIPAYD